MTDQKQQEQQDKQAILEKVIQTQFTCDELKSKIKQNSIETLKEFSKRMKVVEKMKTVAFQNLNPDLSCRFFNQEDLDKNATLEMLLDLLSQFLSTSMGKMAACQTVGIKTFKDMYTKRQKKPNPSVHQIPILRAQPKIGLPSVQLHQVPYVAPIQPIQQVNQPPHQPQFKQKDPILQSQYNQFALQQRQALEHQNLISQSSEQSTVPSLSGGKKRQNLNSKIFDARRSRLSKIQWNNDLFGTDLEALCLSDLTIQLSLESHNQMANLNHQAKKSVKLTPQQENEAHQNMRYPCFFDKKDGSRVQCICQEQQMHEEMVTCTFCFHMQHKSCIYKNRKMKKYVCSSCQLKFIDPLQIPIKTLLRPFRVHRIEDFDNKEDPKTPLQKGTPQMTKYLNIDGDLLNSLKSHKFGKNGQEDVHLITIQVRCIQLNNKEHFIMNFPTFGHLFVNGQNHQYYKIQPPPNDKKRHDKVYDILKFIKPGQNTIEMSHVQKMLRNGKDDDNFVCGIYLVRNIEPVSMISYINNLQPAISIQNTIQKIKEIVLQSQDDDDDNFVQTDSLKIDLRCQITQMRVTNPVRGQWCDHFQCFDLETYISSNSKFTSRKWICPVCPGDKPIQVFKDEFMMRLIEIAGKENYDEFKVEINSKLEVIFDQKTYIMTDDDIIDPNDPNEEEKRSCESSSIQRPPENSGSPKQSFFNQQQWLPQQQVGQKRVSSQMNSDSSVVCLVEDSTSSNKCSELSNQYGMYPVQAPPPGSQGVTSFFPNQTNQVFYNQAEQGQQIYHQKYGTMTVYGQQAPQQLHAHQVLQQYLQQNTASKRQKKLPPGYFDPNQMYQQQQQQQPYYYPPKTESRKLDPRDPRGMYYQSPQQQYQAPQHPPSEPQQKSNYENDQSNQEVIEID